MARRERRRQENDAAREWKGDDRSCDLVKQFSIALGVVVALALVLTILFSSPDQPPSTIRQSARTEPVNFVTTAVGELAGTSNTAGYGCPTTATATASTSARPGTVWGGRFRRRGSAVWWRRRGRSSVPPRIA